jgi:hypothetical protein
MLVIVWKILTYTVNEYINILFLFCTSCPCLLQMCQGLADILILMVAVRPELSVFIKRRRFALLLNNQPLKTASFAQPITYIHMSL